MSISASGFNTKLRNTLLLCLSEPRALQIGTKAYSLIPQGRVRYYYLSPASLPSVLKMMEKLAERDSTAIKELVSSAHMSETTFVPRVRQEQLLDSVVLTVE